MNRIYLLVVLALLWGCEDKKKEDAYKAMMNNARTGPNESMKNYQKEAAEWNEKSKEMDEESRKRSIEAARVNNERR